jgi:uncharacterized membrane protein YukC
MDNFLIILKWKSLSYVSYRSWTAIPNCPWFDICDSCFCVYFFNKKQGFFSYNRVSFASIVDMNDKDFIKEAKTVDEITLCEMILSQIVINSKIAERKMKHFSVALYCGIFFVLITVILVVFINFL